MKTQLKATAVICIALFGLAACSSGGSDSRVDTSAGITNGSNGTGGSSNGNGSSSGNSSSNGSTTTPAPQTYNGAVLIGESRNGANVSATSLSSASLDSVVIDGTTVALTQPGISAGTFTTISNNTQQTTASGKILSHMRFGAYRDFNVGTGKNPTYMFALGSITPAADVPTTGTAKYEGLSVFSTIGGGVWDTGTSSFDVDFGTKHISGKVGNSSFEVPLSATINGSSFSGIQNGVTTSGHFFGPNAAEMGGVFNGSVVEPFGVVDYMGSFGAVKK